MRVVAALVLVVLASALGASEEKLVKRLEDVMGWLKRANGTDTEAAVSKAAQALVDDGPMETQAASVASALRQVVDIAGPAVRYDKLGSRDYGSFAQMFWYQVVFEHGVGFVRVVTAKTSTDKTVVNAFAISPDPTAVLPLDLLAPDAASVRR